MVSMEILSIDVVEVTTRIRMAATVVWVSCSANQLLSWMECVERTFSVSIVTSIDILGMYAQSTVVIAFMSFSSTKNGQMFCCFHQWLLTVTISSKVFCVSNGLQDLRIQHCRNFLILILWIKHINDFFILHLCLRLLQESWYASTSFSRWSYTYWLRTLSDLSVHKSMFKMGRLCAWLTIKWKKEY